MSAVNNELKKSSVIINQVMSYTFMLSSTRLEASLTLLNKLPAPPLRKPNTPTELAAAADAADALCCDEVMLGASRGGGG